MIFLLVSDAGVSELEIGAFWCMSYSNQPTITKAAYTMNPTRSEAVDGKSETIIVRTRISASLTVIVAEKWLLRVIVPKGA